MNVRTKSSRLALGAFAACALACASAFAQGPGTPDGDEALRKAFAAADANKDGVIEVDEAVGDAVLLFITFDRNRDRFLTTDETPRHDPARLKAADRNGDGKLSVGEVAADRVWEFFEADTNSNGVLTFEEVRAYVTKVRGARK